MGVWLRDGHIHRRGVQEEKLFVPIHFLSLGPNQVCSAARVADFALHFALAQFHDLNLTFSVTSDGVEVRHRAVLFLKAWLAEAGGRFSLPGEDGEGG